MTILDAPVLVFQRREFVKVRRKDYQTANVFHHVFRDGPSETVPIECGRAAAQFIHNDEAAFRGDAQNCKCPWPSFLSFAGAFL